MNRLAGERPMQWWEIPLMIILWPFALVGVLLLTTFAALGWVKH
jgi:hypothetical protein